MSSSTGPTLQTLEAIVGTHRILTSLTATAFCEAAEPQINDYAHLFSDPIFPFQYLKNKVY